MASRIKDGYGRFAVKRRLWLAHRVSYIIHTGPIDEGLCVLHKCDNPKCVNPAHLFLGTIQDNSDDKMAKGRDADVRGVQNPRAKLTDAQVLEIRAKHHKTPQRKLAEEYGVARSLIQRIHYRQAWTHI